MRLEKLSIIQDKHQKSICDKKYYVEEFDKLLNYVNDESDRIIEFHRLLLKEIPIMYEGKIKDHFF